jgi:hypothetical protein
MWAMKTK